MKAKVLNILEKINELISNLLKKRASSNPMNWYRLNYT